MGDLKWVRPNRLTVLVFGHVLWGVAKIGVAMATTYTHLVLYALADGMANGKYGFDFKRRKTKVKEFLSVHNHCS